MISAKHLELLNSRCDIVAASRGPRLTPSICWGMGAHVHEDRKTVTVWLHRDQAHAVLADVAATRAIAVVFSVPYLNFSLQLKGTDARARAATESDAALLARHVGNMVRELGLVGCSEPFTRAAFDYPVQALVAVEYTVDRMFEQTPGPNAGKPVAANS